VDEQRIGHDEWHIGRVCTASRLTNKAFGDEKRLAPGATTEATQEKNRRVVLRIALTYRKRTSQHSATANPRNRRTA
jgi:hypothetical protein